MKKRALALVLSICVAFSVVPEVALAEEPVEAEAEATGEEENLAEEPDFEEEVQEEPEQPEEKAQTTDEKYVEKEEVDVTKENEQPQKSETESASEVETEKEAADATVEQTAYFYIKVNASDTADPSQADAWYYAGTGKVNAPQAAEDIAGNQQTDLSVVKSYPSEMPEITVDGEKYTYAIYDIPIQNTYSVNWEYAEVSEGAKNGNQSLTDNWTYQVKGTVVLKPQETKGIDGNITWELKDHVLILSGTGDMKNYSKNGNEYAPWYGGDFTKVEVREGVTSIGCEAFYDNRKLEDVEMPESVMQIRRGAFWGCKKLKNVRLPEKLSIIESFAFSYCDLRNVELPDKMERIEKCTFCGCINLENIKIPERVTYIGDSAFEGCSKLKSIEIPDNVIYIGDVAFSDCSKLANVKISDNVTYMGYSVFSLCVSLEKVELPKKITRIESSLFYGCFNLKEVTLPPEVEIFSLESFYGCGNLERLRIPNSLRYIGTSAFYGCGSKEIVYEGTIREWNSIRKSVDNDILTHFAAIYCTDGTINGNDENNPFLTPASADEEVIEKVKLYTSDGGKYYYAQLEAIKNCVTKGNLTPEQYASLLNEFYTINGISSLEEGTVYWEKAREARKAYDYLQNDNCYLAYNTYKYMKDTSQGQATEAMLVLNDEIFNGNTIAQIKDLDFWLKHETKTISRYKAMLLDFMDCNLKSFGAMDYVSKVKDVAQGVVDVTDGQYQKELEKCGDDLDKLLAFLQEHSSEVNEKGDLHVQGYTVISDDIKETSFFLKAEKDFFEDIQAFANVQTRVEQIKRYETFLEQVEAGEGYLPYGMIVAASQLRAELVNPYKNIWQDIFSQIVSDGFLKTDFYKDTIKDGIQEKIKEQLPNIFSVMKTYGDFSTTVTLGKLVTNSITGVGKMVDKAACVNAYANLGIYYSDLLDQCKNEFLADQSLENAWKFYDTYQLLFSIRVNGEQAYLDMSGPSGIDKYFIGDKNYFGIKDKKAFVQKEFDYLNNYCLFELKNKDGLDGTHFYAQKAVIKCPVDVEIYDRNGNLVYTVSDGKEMDETTDIGRFICYYDPVTADFKKVIYLNDADAYTIKTVGTDAGNVQIQMAEKQDDGTLTKRQISGIPVLKDGIIKIDLRTGAYEADKENDGVIDETGIMTDVLSNEIIAEKMTLSASALEMNVGETQVLGVEITPQDASYTNVIWTSDNEDVVTVNGGGLIAKQEGTAVITASLGQLTASCEVVVKEKQKPDEPVIDKSSWLYDDVPEKTGWRYEAIKYVKDYGIMNGISGTHNFAPDEPLTRAMFATIIYRMEGSPKASYSTKFPDVPDGNYFSVPIIWANKAGIINGHSNTGLFGTRENITREDMVVIMYRYCRVKGLASGGRADLGRFPDADQISGYAKEAVQWAVANGIINGRSNTGMLDPKGNASRVETAAIIQRFMTKIK